jgi:hypothetical protein
LVVLAAAAGAALGRWGVRVQAAPAGEAGFLEVSIKVFGRPLIARAVRAADAEAWGRWTNDMRTMLGALLGAAAGLLLAGRAYDVGYRLFTILHTLRGAALGALAGVVLCGLGFAVLGAVICAMLEEPGWTLGDALGHGARLGGPLGVLLGAFAGAVIGAITAAAGATKQFHMHRPVLPEPRAPATQ